jgi:hypothetical protein
MISVPHRAPVRDEVSRVDDTYMNSLKRGFEMAGERVQSVVEITPLRDKRRDVGYMAEDGTTKLRGAANQESDLYGEEWLKDFVERIAKLDADPHINFVRILTGMANVARETFINESLENRATAARIEQARRLVNEIRAKQSASDSSGSSVADQKKRWDDARAKVDALAAKIDAVESTRANFLALVDDEDNKRLANRIIEVQGDAAADVMQRLVRHLAWRYGAQWQQNAPEAIIQLAVSLVNQQLGPRGDQAVKNNMPLAARVVMFLKTAQVAESMIDAKNALMETKAVKFRVNSDYAADAYLFYRDLSLLTQLVGDIDVARFDKMSFVLYAHLNKMRRRYGLDEEMNLRRPVPERVPRAVPAVVLDDDALEDIGDGNTQLYTPAELATAQSAKNKNDNPRATLDLLDALLQPFVYAFLPLAFFVDRDAPLVKEAGIGVPVTVETENDVPLPREPVLDLLGKTVAVFGLDFANSVAAINEILPSVFQPSQAMKKRYQDAAIKTLVVERGILRAFAETVTAYADAAVAVSGITPLKLAALRGYLADARKSEEAYDVFTRTLLATRPARLDEANSLLRTDSAMQFYRTFRSDISRDSSVSTQLAAVDAIERKDEEEQLKIYVALETQRRERIEANQEKVALTLQQALVDNYVPTASVALSPMNSGLLFYTDVTISALSAAYSILQQHVPCVVRNFRSSDQLIVSDEYSHAYAALVNSQVRLADTRNPTTYRQTVHETRARLQARSALDQFRQVCGADKGIRHVQGCTCLFR